MQRKVWKDNRTDGVTKGQVWRGQEPKQEKMKNPRRRTNLEVQRDKPGDDKRPDRRGE
jgi:hypothetical protein